MELLQCSQHPVIQRLQLLQLTAHTVHQRTAAAAAEVMQQHMLFVIS
jgi:hypothetical protein